LAEGAFLRPIVAALSWAVRWPAIFAWIVLIAVATGTRALQTRAYADVAAADFALGSGLASIGTIVVNAALFLFLARIFLAPSFGRARPLYLRWLGLYLLSVAIVWFIMTAGTLAIFSGNPSQFMMTYGTTIVGALGAIVVFPIVVRSFAAAAGLDEQRLGKTWAFAFQEGRYAYFWYAACAVLFPILMVFTFVNLLPQGGEANALPGNVIQSTITATGSLLTMLLAIVAAQRTAPGPQHQAQVFA
jgi:hypothetical protein